MTYRRPLSWLPRLPHWSASKKCWCQEAMACGLKLAPPWAWNCGRFGGSKPGRIGKQRSVRSQLFGRLFSGHEGYRFYSYSFHKWWGLDVPVGSPGCGQPCGVSATPEWGCAAAVFSESRWEKIFLGAWFADLISSFSGCGFWTTNCLELEIVKVFLTISLWVEEEEKRRISMRLSSFSLHSEQSWSATDLKDRGWHQADMWPGSYEWDVISPRGSILHFDALSPLCFLPQLVSVHIAAGLNAWMVDGVKHAAFDVLLDELKLIETNPRVIQEVPVTIFHQWYICEPGVWGRAPYDPFRRQLEQLRWEDGWRKRASGRAEAKLWDFAIIFICVFIRVAKAWGDLHLDGIFMVIFSFQSHHPLRIPIRHSFQHGWSLFPRWVLRGTYRDLDSWILNNIEKRCRQVADQLALPN